MKSRAHALNNIKLTVKRVFQSKAVRVLKKKMVRGKFVSSLIALKSSFL